MSGSGSGSNAPPTVSSSSSSSSTLTLSSIDEVIASSRNQDQSPNALAAYVAALDKLSQSASRRKDGDVFLRTTKDGSDPLAVLDPAADTIAYAYVL